MFLLMLCLSTDGLWTWTQPKANSFRLWKLQMPPCFQRAPYKVVNITSLLSVSLCCPLHLIQCLPSNGFYDVQFECIIYINFPSLLEGDVLVEQRWWVCWIYTWWCMNGDITEITLYIKGSHGFQMSKAFPWMWSSNGKKTESIKVVKDILVHNDSWCYLCLRWLWSFSLSSSYVCSASSGWFEKIPRIFFNSSCWCHSWLLLSLCLIFLVSCQNYSRALTSFP